MCFCAVSLRGALEKSTRAWWTIGRVLFAREKGLARRARLVAPPAAGRRAGPLAARRAPSSQHAGTPATSSNSSPPHTVRVLPQRHPLSPPCLPVRRPIAAPRTQHNRTHTMLAKAQTSSRLALASTRARAVVARPARRSTVSVAASHGNGLPIDLRGASFRGRHWRPGAFARVHSNPNCCPSSLCLTPRPSLPLPTPIHSIPSRDRQEGVHCRRRRRPGALWSALGIAAVWARALFSRTAAALPTLNAPACSPRSHSSPPLTLDPNRYYYPRASAGPSPRRSRRPAPRSRWACGCVPP